MALSGLHDVLSRWGAGLLQWSDIPLRAALAATFITHGYAKFTGGAGNFGTALAGMGVPAPGLMAYVVILAELGGGIAMALGLATRLAALGHMSVMAVAILAVHGSQGFAMRGGDGGHAAGYEWQLALFLIGLCLFLRGAGPLSADRLIWNAWTSMVRSVPSSPGR